MMLRERKVGKRFRIEGSIGPQRIRLALGTQNRENAHYIVGQIEQAVGGGAESKLWPALRRLVPENTFEKLAAIVDYQEQPKAPAPSWTEFIPMFEAQCLRRIAVGKFRASTFERYKFETREFSEFLKERNIDALEQINGTLVDEFKIWRIERIRARSKFAQAKSIVLSAAILHRVFAFALEKELISKNPVKLEGRPGEETERGSQPFKAAELQKMREHAGPDFLAFALLRWTGLRGSDAVALTWADVDFDAREISRVTQKRGKRVIVPIQTELLFALEVERDRRKPNPWERVLLNPETGRPFTRPRLYSRIMAVGRRACVVNANPHRFRDTLAVQMLGGGATPYDVAKTLGDTIETVEKHYAPFVPELRERVRRIINSVVEPRLEPENGGTFLAQPVTNPKQVQ